MSEQEFHERVVETVVHTMIPMIDGVRFPEGLSQDEGRVYHRTYLTYFSFFAWNFPTWLQAISSRCPYQDVRAALIEDCVDEEVGDVDAGGRCHVDVLYDEAEFCGATREEISATRATPVISACINALDNLARTLSWESSFAAVAGLEIAQSEPAVVVRTRIMEQVLTPEQIEQSKSARDSNSLADRTGLRPDQLVFASLHEYKDLIHGGGELALLMKYGVTRSVQEEMLWAIEAGAETYATMRMEIDRMARAAVGLEPLRAVGTRSARFADFG